MKIVVYILLRIYTFVFMGWCLVPFALLTFDKYWKAFGLLNYMGIIFFLPWGILYGPTVRALAKMTRPREKDE